MTGSQWLRCTDIVFAVRTVRFPEISSLCRVVDKLTIHPYPLSCLNVFSESLRVCLRAISFEEQS